MKYLISILVFTLIGRAVGNCAYGTTNFPRLPNVTVSSFSYDGLKGPLNWYGLNESANAMCDKGTHQSPIVIDSSVAAVNGSDFQWEMADYPDGAEFENLGTNVEVIVNGSLTDSKSGTQYKLAQFHFHVPSEHRINDEIFAMEMHWVFQSAAKQVAVIGFIVELGEKCDTDPVLASVFAAINGISSPGEAEMTGPLDFKELISKFKNSKVWRYSGSLTTPPCTESVDWLLSQQYLYLDLNTWLAVKKVVKFNARYTQNSGGGVNLVQNAANELSCNCTSP